MRVEAIPAAGAEAMAFKALVHLARGQIKANWAHQGLHVYFGRERHVATVLVPFGAGDMDERHSRTRWRGRNTGRFRPVISSQGLGLVTLCVLV